MSCDPEIACVPIQIELGSIVDTLKNKVWFDTDVRAQKNALVSFTLVCQLVESRSSDLAKCPEFVDFFALLAKIAFNGNEHWLNKKICSHIYPPSYKIQILRWKSLAPANC